MHATVARKKERSKNHLVDRRYRGGGEPQKEGQTHGRLVDQKKTHASWKGVTHIKEKWNFSSLGEKAIPRGKVVGSSRTKSP